MQLKPGIGRLALAGLIVTTPCAEAALQGRDLDPGTPGFEAYYDTELDITWLSNFGLIRTSGFDADGRVSWDDAQRWIGTLNGAALYGHADWRLPRTLPVNGVAYQLAERNNGSTDVGVAPTGVGWGKASEMGHLYYVTLGNKGYCEPTPAGNDACVQPAGWLNKDFGPFTGITTYVYWSGSELPGTTTQAWYFYAYYGNQWYTSKDQTYSALAVRGGDTLPVPEPASAALWALGAGGLALALRRRGRR